MLYSDLEKEMVYLAYRDIFKDNLAKLRKRSKVRNVVEKHKDHLHHKQLADSMDSEKTCRILADLLAARLFESESAAKTIFPTLFSPRELGNDTALIVKCIEEECDPNASPFRDILRSTDTSTPNGASTENSLPFGQHRIDRKAGRIRKPARATTNPARAILQVGKAVPREVFHEDSEKGPKVPNPTRDCDITPTNPTYLPSRLQHLILTKTQQLLEECCYNFAQKWFPSMLEANCWDAPEAVELNTWWKALSKRDIPPTAIDLSHGQSLAVLFRRVISIRHCAVHRRPRIPVNEIEKMIRDACLLSQAMQDDLRALQLLHWHTELESLVAHLQLRTNSQREAAEAELQNIHDAKVETEDRLAKLELRASQLTQYLEVEGRTHQPIDAETLRPLEEAFSKPALANSQPVIAQDQVGSG